MQGGQGLQESKEEEVAAPKPHYQTEHFTKILGRLGEAIWELPVLHSQSRIDPIP